MNRSNPLPGFLIIGAQKSATRWLSRNLGRHPDLHTAPNELEFFNHHYDRGIPWYADQFHPEGDQMAGEATPGYMFWRERPHIQAARIDGTLPNVRLLAVLRNPMDRARSAFLHHVLRGRIDPSTHPIDWLSRADASSDPLGIVSGGWYGASLQPYVRRFGSRLCVIYFDDITADAARGFRMACEHLGVDPRHVPADVGRRSDSGEVAARSGGHPPTVLQIPTDEFRQATYPYFEADLGLLERMLATDLSRWRI